MGNLGLPSSVYNGGIGVTSYFKTKGQNDVYATHLANLSRGGVHSVASIAEMNAITVERRMPFMLCVVANIGGGISGLYWLATTDHNDLGNNANWEQVPLGMTINGALNFVGFLDGTNVTLTDAVGVNGDTYIVSVTGTINNPNVFNGVETNLTPADYVIYDGTNSVWYHIPRNEFGLTWNTLLGKPTTFPPDPHTHTVAQISDFPDMNLYVLKSNVVATINVDTPDTRLAQVGAIKAFVAQELANLNIPAPDLSSYYTKTEVDNKFDLVSAPALNIVATQGNLATIQSPSYGDTAYVTGEKSLYRYEEGTPDAWVLKYRSALTSTEVKTYYESNSDTNAFTDALLAKLNALLSLNSNANVVAAIDAELGLTSWKSGNKIINAKVATNTPIVTNGPLTLDDVALVTGDRVLVKDQSTLSQNGVYVVDTAGAWTKVSLSYEGMFVFVTAGTANGNRVFLQNTNSNDLVFTEFLDDAIITAEKTASNEITFTKKDGSTIVITLAAGGSGGHIIEDEGTPLAQRSKLNFTGDGVSVADDAGNDRTNVQIVKDTGAQIKTKLFAESDTNNFDDAAQSKLAGIEAGATADQTGAEIKALYEAEANTNAFTDAEKSKLAALVDNYKGFYADQTALTTAHPTANGGDWAILGSTDTVWVWDTDGAPAWVDTGSNAPTINVINDLTTGGTTDALSAQQGVVLKGLIDNISVTPVIQAATTFSVNGSKSLDLDTFDFDEGITLNANMTSLVVSNGTQGKTYTVKLIQGATGGTLTLAANWLPATGYIIGDKVIFVDSGFYHVYNCNTNHTSHATDYTNDLANWDLIYRVEAGNKIILSVSEGDVDFLEIFVEDTNLYRIRPIYA